VLIENLHAISNWKQICKFFKVGIAYVEFYDAFSSMWLGRNYISRVACQTKSHYFNGKNDFL